MSEDTMTDEDKATLRNALDVLKRMEREGTLEPTKAPLKHLHSARVVCGACGVGNNITLGLASAIACGDCGTEIALGDGTADEMLMTFLTIESLAIENSGAAMRSIERLCKTWTR